MSEIDDIKRAFLRRQGWRCKPYYGWASPQRPFTWMPLIEAYELASSVYRHWTSFKVRRASPAGGSEP